MKQKHQDTGSYSNDVRPRQRVSQKSYRFIKKSKNSARASTSLLSLPAQLRYVLWRELELTPQDLKKKRLFVLKLTFSLLLPPSMPKEDFLDVSIL